MKSRLLAFASFVCLASNACGKQPNVTVSTCASDFEWKEKSVTTAPRTAPGIKVGQNVFFSKSIVISKIMLRAVTNGLSSVTIKMYKGAGSTTPETGTPILNFTITTGLNKTQATDENWFDLPEPLSITMEESSSQAGIEYYSIVFESTGGNLVVDYGYIGSGRNLRYSYYEYASGTWGGSGGDTLNGISIGLAGTIDCAL